MDVKRFFDQSDLDAVARAVSEVEQRTSGEVVPYVVAASDSYEGARWRGATLGILLAVLAAAGIHELSDLWGVWVLAWILGPPIVGGIIGFVAPLLSPALRRLLVDEATLERQVQGRAESAFLHEEVFHTRDRTGILIFMSLLEHRVVILADAGINAKVRQDEWQSIVNGIVAGIKRGEPAQALVEGISRCGALLEERGVEIRPDDFDELPDELRLRES